LKREWGIAIWEHQPPLGKKKNKRYGLEESRANVHVKQKPIKKKKKKEKKQ